MMQFQVVPALAALMAPAGPRPGAFEEDAGEISSAEPALSSLVKRIQAVLESGDLTVRGGMAGGATEEGAAGAQAAGPAGGGNLAKVTENLLYHIPGEASGFYLLAASSVANPTKGTLGLIFILALVLLFTVRLLAKASRGIIITTVGAFILWMAIFDQGFLHVAFPKVLPPPIGFILASFYSIFVTLLASAGKLGGQVS